MKKQILNLGRALKKAEQKKVNGGNENGEKCCVRHWFLGWMGSCCEML